MNDTTPTQTPAPKPPVQLTLSWRTLAIILLVVIAGMTYVWKPWAKPTAARTITVQGQATVTAVPDRYDFQPVFEDTDLKAVTATGNDAVAQLKKLGVKDADIKTAISSAGTVTPEMGANKPTLIYPYPTTNPNTYTITLTVTDKALAQKVSDYLANTPATGEITPSASFSKATADKLDLEARSKASDDAKSKATVTAKQLGATVGKVITISDTGYGGIIPLAAGQGVSSSLDAKSAAGPTVQPGTNDVNYSFTVEFELK